MATRRHTSVSYREVLANPIAWRVWTAATISYLGDFIGLGALLLIGFDRSGGQPIGPASVFAAQAIPALAVSAGIGPWLDRIPRRGALVALCLAGASALAIPVLSGGIWPVLTTAAIIGAVRTAFNSIRTGAIADGIPRGLRGGLIALVLVSNQTSEVVGYLAGSTTALLIGAPWALLADALTFLAAAFVFLGLKLPARPAPRARASMTAGVRAIFADPTLAMLVPAVWVGLSLGAMPQTLATAALAGSHRAWVPAAMAAMGAGATIAAVAVGRTRLSERVLGQLRYITVCGVAFVLTGAALRAVPPALVLGNFAIGLGMGWVAAAQTTFVHVVPPARIAHVTGTMIASLIVLEGGGALAFGAVAGALGVPAAYIIAGTVLAAAGLAASAYGRAHPRALDLQRPRAETAQTDAA